MERVGGPTAQYGSTAEYEKFGRVCRRDFLALLPTSFSWDGARVLDFGCGAGRTLRHFAPEASRAAEFWGCDIDAASIEWVQANLCPPFHAFCNAVVPPLPLEDASLDLIYAMSVFTHLADTWSAWLLELHRVLKPGGTLLATTLGPGSAATDLGRPWDEERIGMLTTLPHESFDDARSGPVVFHSEWWIREHWGRVFDVLDYWPSGFGVGGPQPPPLGQGCVAARKRDIQRTPADLSRPADDPREWEATATNLDVVQHREAEWRARAISAEAELAAISKRRSWRLARALARVGRPFARRPANGRVHHGPPGSARMAQDPSVQRVPQP